MTTSPPEGFAGSTADVVGRIVFEKTGGALRLIAFDDETRTALDRIQRWPGGPFDLVRGARSRHITARLSRIADLRQLHASFPTWNGATVHEVASQIIENLRTEFP